jgi:hypothetical protein
MLASSGRFRSRRDRTAVGLLLLACWPLAGCGPGAKFEPDAKTRLTKVLRLYQKYVEKYRAGPADEQALHAFGEKLTPNERDEYLIGDDLESIFTSPRDHQKYVIQVGLRLDPGGKMRAVAWEATGKAGRRFVALSNGYVEEYDEATFNKYKR